MAETLVELVARIKADATQLEKGLSDAEKQTEASSKKMSDSLKKIGIAMAASGAAITAAMGLMGKSAIDEEINIKRLGLALKGVGVNYDDVKDSLEATIAATQRKTGIADNEQRDVLGKLILVTKDYDKALSLLPLTLNLAAKESMNAAAASVYIGKAYEDLENGAESISIRMGTTSVQFKDLAEVEKLVGNAAEELKNPFGVLSVAMSDVSETIGAFLIPAIKDTIDKILDITDKAQVWAKENPELARNLTLVATELGILLTVIGTAIIVIPKAVKAWQEFRIVLLAVHGSIGPVGWVVAGLSLALMAALPWLMKTTDITKGLATAMSDLEKQNIKTRIQSKFSADQWKEIVAAGYLTEEQFKKLAESLGVTTKALYDQLKAAGLLESSMANSTNRNIYIRDIEKTAEIQKSSTETIKKAIESLRKAIESLRAEYGDLGNAIKSKGDMARQAAQVAKDALSSELDKARESTDKQLGFLSKLYAEKIRLVNAGAEEAIKGIQGQIDAIDKQTELENRALEDRRDKDSLAKLSGKERIDFIAEMERKKVLREREDRKDALRDSIEKVREDTQNKVNKLNEELAVAQQVERDKLSATEERIKQTNISLDIALNKELERLANELKTYEKQKIDELAVLDKALADAETKQQASYDKRLQQARDYQSSLTSIMGGGVPAGQTGMPIPPGGLFTTPGGSIVGPGEGYIDSSGQQRFAPMANGGIVTQPTLGMVGEAGPEAIIPLNEAGAMGGVTINFTQPVFFDREDTMIRFVDMIRKGIQRQDRLRFGGAYNG